MLGNIHVHIGKTGKVKRRSGEGDKTRSERGDK